MGYTELENGRRKPKIKIVQIYMNGNGKNAKIHIYNPQPFTVGQRVDVLIHDDKQHFLILGLSKKSTPTGPLLTQTGNGVSFTSVTLYKTMGLKGRKFNTIGKLIKHTDGREGYLVAIPDITQDNGYVPPVNNLPDDALEICQPETDPKIEDPTT